MKQKLLRGLAVSVCGAMLLAPMSVSANQAVLKDRHLYEVRTLTGQFQPGFLDGSAHTASLYNPTSIMELNDGTLLISDTDNHLLRLYSYDQVTRYSGTILDLDEHGHPLGAFHDDSKENAFYSHPSGLAIDQQGNIYVADSNNHSIRIITQQGEVKTIAGTGVLGYKDGRGKDAQFYAPSDVAVDGKGNIYVADTLNHAIRKIDASGNVTTLNKLSDRIVEFFGGMVSEAGDYNDGPLSEALFNEPTALAIDEKGNLYVSDTGNQRIRYIDLTAQEVTTVAGGGSYGQNDLYAEAAYQDGAAEQARFSSPMGLSIASDGSVLIADRNNHTIRLLADGMVYTLAGQAEEHGRLDGVMIAAMLNEPTDVIELRDGSLAITDSSNNKVRIIKRYEQPQHEEDGSIHVIINGKLLLSDVVPQLHAGRTYVPLRALVEELGYEITYNKESRQTSLVIDEHTSLIFSDRGEATVRLTEEEAISIDSTSIMVQNRLFVPVRFVTEELGYDVQWDQEQKHVVIRPYLFLE